MKLDINALESYLEIVTFKHPDLDIWIATTIQYCKIVYLSNSCISNNDYMLMLSELTRLSLEKDINK